MGVCEKCWKEAQGVYLYGSVADEYIRLININDCSPEEQAGITQITESESE